MLTANNLSKAYGPNIILQNASFSVSAGDRVGLIGPNGSGKTTLLRLLAGAEKPDSGHVARHPADLRLGYLAQGFEPDPTLTLAQVLHRAVGDPATLEAELAQLAAALVQEPQRADLQAAYDATLHQLNRCDVGRLQTTLTSLGLADVEQEQRVGQLSGGQKTRLALALVLLQDPQFLLLDEPINHLDIPSRSRFEEALTHFEGTILAVVHDRYFIDRFATDRWLVENHGLRTTLLRR